MLSKFEQYLLEAENTESYEWGKPVYHGTSLNIAKKILKLKQFSFNESNGVNEMGRGVYTHPSMNRTSPWVSLTAKNGLGAFIKIVFKRKLTLAIPKRGITQRELIDKNYDGVYDKNGNTQVPHQILLFNFKPLGGTNSKLNTELIDWDATEIIPFNKDTHGYLSGYDNPDEKQYYF